MKVTIKDVAREANVSIATVSRVINGKDRVKKETRLKIEKAIKKLNFRPDQAARTMIMKETKTIGLMIPVLTNEYWAGLSEVIQDTLGEKGYTLIIGSDNMNPDKQEALFNVFQERKVDGIIVGSVLSDKTVKHVDDLKQEGTPIVSLYPFYSNVNCVTGDHVQGAMDAVQHLLQLGHRKIAYIGAASTSDYREMGYRNALMMSSIKMDESIIIKTNDMVRKFSHYGYESINKLIESKGEFTAVFCANDLMAIGAIKALKEAGIKVPEDVAVVGFDDISMAGLYQPSLTTVQQPIKEMGKATVDMLLELILHKDEPIAKKVTFPMKLIVRESCGAKKFMPSDNKQLSL
ncbi:LacI family DNA-binding transcriptional regulator [Peribacillus sp. NPDC096379]|uniref:LacI family DNA-binding transcriptional regulator n=1 Tax=Peribacillus sp. NPDC096379 TaxID=3364393 RepID=UPI00380FBA39